LTPIMSPFSAFVERALPRLPDEITRSSGMNEKRDQKDDRQRNADQPK